ncbi:MAG: serine/threonine-protein kinase [Sandaracinaceae bacterium]
MARQNEARRPLALAGYEELEVVASGGMGEVVAASQRRPGGFARVVAVKRILPRLARLPESRQMMRDEARITSWIRHPNVVTIHDYVEADGVPHLVMELLAGAPLSRLLGGALPAKLPPIAAAFLIAEAARGLHAAHEVRDERGVSRDIVHRDVSPDNLYVTEDAGVKLLDFGVARARDRLAKTAPGQVKGRVRYMCPEYLNQQPVDRRADVYALGLILFEALTGEQAFARGHLVEAVCDVIRGNRPRLRDRLPNEPLLDEVIERACALCPNDRFGSAESLAHALDRYVVEQGGVQRARALVRALVLRRRSSEAEVEGATLLDSVQNLRPSERPPRSPSDPGMPSAAPQRRRRRRRLGVKHGLLVALAILGFGVGFSVGLSGCLSPSASSAGVVSHLDLPSELSEAEDPRTVPAKGEAPIRRKGTRECQVASVGSSSSSR